MSGYFLVARNRKDNSFQVLKLKESWFLGQSRGRDDVLTRENALESIDLVTTRFTSESEMAERMAMNGYIADSDVDIFIASKKKHDGRNYIKFDEVIYNPKKNRRVGSLRRLANVSLQTDFRLDKDDLNAILDEAISTTYFVDDFYAILVGGETNVPRGFSELFGGIQSEEDIPYDLKEKFDLKTSDYLTVRSMVEALNRFDALSCSEREDRFERNRMFIENNLSARMALIPELAVQLDDNYIEGQLSIFSLLDSEKKEKVKEATTALVAEVKPAFGKIVIPRKGVSVADKKKEIYRVLRNSPRNTFYKDKGGLFKVNHDSLFKQPLLDGEKKKLDTYLTGRLPKFFAEYIVDYANLREGQSFCSPSEICEMQKDVEYDAQRINNRLKSAKTLNMVYEWCVLYDGCRKREAALTTSNSDDKAKVYGKK